MCSLLLCNTFLLRCKTKTQIDISMATPCCNIHLHPEDPCLLQSNEGATAQPMIQELASETASNLSCRIVVRQARAQAAGGGAEISTGRAVGHGDLGKLD
jgi:hypothetical protein